MTKKISARLLERKIGFKNFLDRVLQEPEDLIEMYDNNLIHVTDLIPRPERTEKLLFEESQHGA